MKNKKHYRVAFLADPLDLQSAGIHVYLKTLLNGLENKDGIEYHLIRARKSDEDFGLTNHLVPFDNGGSQLIRKWFTLPNYVRREAFDLVIEPAHFGPFNVPNSIKRLTIIHDLTPLLYSHYHPFGRFLAHKIFLKRILRKADLIITNSQHTKNDVINYYPFTIGKIDFIYPAINPIFKKTDNRDPLKKYGIDKPYLLSVGTVEPRKNYITTIRAFESFKNNNPDSEHELVIVGRRGWYSEDLFHFMDKLEHKDKIKIINDVETHELPSFYSNCELFVFASHYEGFGFPILEANNCGAVCLCAENSSIKEISSSFAHFFDPTNFIQLSKKIEDLLRQEKPDDSKLTIKNSNFSSLFHEKVKELLIS